MFKDKRKIYLSAIIELIVLVIFTVISVIMFNYEYVVLNPWIFILPLGVIFLTINSLILMFVFRK